MIRILFVCLGNIYRSPMAEAVFNHLVKEAGLQEHYSVDSAGTGNWHVGDPADRRTLAVLDRKGIDHPSRARQIRPADFEKFDHLVVMDDTNHSDVVSLGRAYEIKVSRLMDWHPNPPRPDVGDPYYGPESGFEVMYNQIREACEHMLSQLEENRTA